MNVVLNSSHPKETGRFESGKYSRSFGTRGRPPKLTLNFQENGKISMDPDGTVLGIQITNLQYRTFGNVIRIFGGGDAKNHAYYSYFFTGDILHLSALMDECINRKLSLNGAWKKELPSGT